MFKLTRPCVTCPFKRGSQLGLPEERILQIVAGDAFQCHKTVDYDNFDDPRLRQGDKPQQCAGLMALLYRERVPNLIMRMAMAWGHLLPSKLDPDNEAFASLQEALDHHKNINAE